MTADSGGNGPGPACRGEDALLRRSQNRQLAQLRRRLGNIGRAESCPRRHSFGAISSPCLMSREAKRIGGQRPFSWALR